jgi:(E)-4-hydroxy-3-methylbut-2-enyl-diphosphate synthase
MCDTKTEDVRATVMQIKALEKEGCDLIRVAIPTMEAARAILEIKKEITIPLVADIHFDPELAIASLKNGANKIRINPGNIDNKEKIREIINEAKKRNIAIRIGINAGSLEKDILKKHGHPTAEAMVESAIRWINFFEKEGFRDLYISIKSSDVGTVIKANKLLYKKIKDKYKIHLGVTEAGTLIPGIIKNSLALGELLNNGIGDTIRISLTDSPINEIKVAKELLKVLGLYTKEPTIISCPTCGRTEIDLKKLVFKIGREIKKIKFNTKKPIKIAVMGCVVNGPGEAREADFAICGGKEQGAIYMNGKYIKSVIEKDLVKELMKMVRVNCS